jgi:hypothetical protein
MTHDKLFEALNTALNAYLVSEANSVTKKENMEDFQSIVEEAIGELGDMIEEESSDNEEERDNSREEEGEEEEEEVGKTAQDKT